MKALNNQSSMRALLLLLMLALLAGCGASSTSRNSSSTTTTPTTTYVPATTTTDTGNTGAACNVFNSSDISLTGKITSYYSGSTIQEDKLRVRITGLSNRFDNSTNVVLKMFRWKASSNTAVELDQTPLSFTVEVGSSTSYAISNSVTSINIASVASMRQSNNISGTTAAEFFNQTTLVISGVDYSWDVLKLVLYDGTTAIGSADVLMPVFSVSPNTYAASHPSVLAQLHPFWADRAQSLTTSAWGARYSSFCF